MWVRGRKKQDLLQGLITVWVNDNRALIEAIDSEDGQAKRSFGHKAHSS